MTWVLLRGLTREARHWGAFPAMLEAAVGERVIAIDTPGNGERHLERSPLSVGEMAEECRAEMRRRGIPPPWSLLAMSLGAMVALEWSRRWPSEVTQAVLINTSARSVPPWKRLRPRNYATLTKIAASRSHAEREAAVLAMTSNHVQAHAGIVEEWSAIAATAPVSTGNALRQLAAAATFRPRQPQHVPLLFLVSENDGLVASACSTHLASAWQAPLRVHPTAGHDLPLDDPQWVIDQVTAHKKAAG